MIRQGFDVVSYYLKEERNLEPFRILKIHRVFLGFDLLILAITGWWFHVFLCLPLFGEDEPILTNIFQWGGSTTN